MSSRKRSSRSLASRRRQSFRQMVETLEIRLVLSTTPVLIQPVYYVYHAPGTYPAGDVPNAYGFLPFNNGSNTPVGYSPQQVRNAYGVNDIQYGSIAGDGAGQTIAIVDAYDNPSFVDSTASNFSTSDLAEFDKEFGLPNPPSFTKVNQNGQASPLPGVDPIDPPGGDTWEGEEALDVEWAHSMAPAANIILVETNSSQNVDLFTGAATAATLPGVSAVSMSFGGAEQSGDLASNSTFLATGVTFLASTGDTGSPGGYPAYSPNVVAVGGTSLPLDAAGDYPGTGPTGETGWSGGGGGISQFEPEPVYQESVQTTGSRTIPDVSFDADPETGVAVYDSYDDADNSGPWVEVGGTSLASPSWAGLIAIANQGRALNDLPALTGSTQTLPDLYDIYSQDPGDFNDILHGSNGGFSAGPGYDEVTGLGTPKANLLIPALAEFGAESKVALTVEPPENVIAGGFFGTVVEVQTSSGIPALGFTGTATISLSSGPTGAVFTPVTVPVNNGVAVFDQLSLSQLSNGTGYTFQIVVSTGSTQFGATLLTDPVDVSTPATAGTGAYYPVPVDAGMRADVSAVDSDGNAIDNIYLVYSQDYELTNGQLLLENTSGLASKTINWISQDQFSSAAPTINANQSGRVFDIVGTSTNLSVVFQGLSQGLVIEGGLANDDGNLVVPSGTVVGGGLLVDGGNVTLRNVTLTDNEARGISGSKGSTGASGTAGPGGAGGRGATGEGGAIYVAAGSLTLDNDTLMGNVARGGAGGVGGTGGLAGTDSSSTIFLRALPGGPGGAGGVGGTGQGGALYVAGGNVSITSGSMKSNAAVGGKGGQGGFGGHGGTIAFQGGSGGLGGVGGQGQGGGVYLDGGSLSLDNAEVGSNSAAGGAGGNGGTGGTGGSSLGNPRVFGPGGDGGAGGNGGSGSGGGMYVLNGTISWLNSSVNGNAAAGAAGGLGGIVGVEPHGGGGGAAGMGGTGAGGGIFDEGTLTLTGANIAGNRADNGGGIDIDGTLTLNSSQVEGNSAVDDGGGIFSTGVAVVNQSTLSGNSATLGGAIDSSGNFTINSGQLSGNTASQSGGGIYFSGRGTISGTDFDANSAGLGGGIFSLANSILAVTSASFEDNNAASGGGIDNLASLQVFSSSFTANSASGGTTGNSGGGILNNGGTLAITSSTFSANSAADGGAIDNIEGTLSITGGSFTSNTATLIGGAIDTSGGSTISGVLFEGNSAADGSGGAINNQGTLAITNGSLIANNSARAGGGIANAGKLSLADSSLSHNSANAALGSAALGGGIFNSSGTISISGGKLLGNTAAGSGGGIYLKQGSLTIAASTSLSFNSASAGGAIFNADGAVSLTNVSVFNNSAGGAGGAIYNGSTLTVNIAAIFDNSASDGGAINNAGVGTFGDVTLSGDSATGEGGGIFNAGTLNLTNSTIADESAFDGGGVYNFAGQLTTLNVTIAENSVNGGSGGGLDVVGGNAVLFNTIVAANTAGTGAGAPANDISGTVSASSSFNLIGGGGAGGLTDGVNNNLVGAAPKLGSLADNGGPTETIALLAGSPAIDAGGNSIAGVTVPTTDERGALRGGVSGETGINAGLRVDIGAYEASSSYLVTTTTDSLAFGTLRSAVGWANLSFNDNQLNCTNPAPNTVVFDTANLFSTAQTITLTQGSLEFSSTSVPGAIEYTGTSKLTISGGGLSRVLQIDPDVTATISGLTIAGGSSASRGGGIYNEGTLSLSDSTISGNSAQIGGGLDNTATGALSVTDSTFDDNSAASAGGLVNDGTAALIGTTITGNSVINNGGGLYNSLGATATVTQSTITGNSAALGGGIWNPGTLTVNDSTISGNVANGNGGGLSSTGTATVINGTISGNSATFDGGGIYNGSSGILTITDTTLSANSANDGGGIFNDATLSLSNATIADNSAFDGGGIDSDGTLTAINTTIADNQVSDAGGGLNVSAGTTTLYNTIVALNTMGGTTPSDVNGTVDAASASNLIGTGGAGGLIAGTNGNLVGVAPGLASGLANNGGPTQTIALTSGSNAIDAGANAITGIDIPTTDQRGAQRGPAGLNAGLRVDIGAFEASSSYLVVTSGDANVAGTLRSAVAWANASTNANPANIANPAPNTIEFDSNGLFSSPQTITLSGGVIALTNTVTSEAIEDSTLNNVTISGGNLSDVFSVAPGVTATFSDLRITGGFAANNGGAIDDAGTLTLNDDTLSGNQATNGGAIAVETGGILNLSDSTLTSNSATTTGGGIDVEPGGSLTATNVTLANNTGATGGGIVNSGTVVLINATVAYNHAGSNGTGGGLAVSAGGVDTLINTIVASNVAGTGSTASDITLSGGGIVSPFSSNNLIGTGGAGNLVNGSNNNLTGIAAPGLASGLANNGGPTQTIALLANSPAIDHGTASISGGVTVPVTDQRGALRGPSGLDAGAAPDIGAFEESSAYLVTTTSNGPNAGTIEAAVGWANVNINVNPANPVPSAANTIVFDSTGGAFSIPATINLTGPLDFANAVTPVAIDGLNTAGLTLSGDNAVGVLSIAAGTTMSVSGLTISNGSATNGGAIHNLGSLTVTDATISQNSATNGGAIDNGIGATLVVLGSTLSDNSAVTGGAIDNMGVATATNSTIAGNSASLGGGISNSGTLKIVSSTIASNSASTSGGGGGLDSTAGTPSLYDTIVALNTSGSGTTLNDIAGSVAMATTSSHNLVDDVNSSGGLTNGAHGNIVGVGPGFVAGATLANNGGPTETIALAANSAALNTGAATIAGATVPLNDQRGASRNFNMLNDGTTIDMGAYEISTGYLVTTAADSMAGGTLRSALAWASSNPSNALSGPNTIRFDPTLFNATTPQTIVLSPALGPLVLANTGSGVLIEGPGALALSISGNGLVGVFSVDGGVTATVTDSTITDGLAATSGGGIINNLAANLTLTNDVFTNDAASFYGGAIYNNSGTLTITNTTFANDSATFGLGGAIDNTGTLTVSNSTFTGGNAYQGGAIDNRSGSLAVTNSTFTSNIAIMGGAIFNDAVATVFGSTMANNAALPTAPGSTPTTLASFDGGAIANDLAGVLTLTNSTLAGNAAGQSGGAIDTVGVLTAVNDTIAYNSVAPGGSGGGIYAPSGTTNLFNTIVALNTSGTGTTESASDLSGNVAQTSAFNLIGTGGAGGLTDGTNGNQVSVAVPGLATTLANNGGPTLTLALLAGSPAIDAGSNALAVNSNGSPLSFDQRGQGFPRIVNSVVDIGAFERALATTTIVTSSPNPSVVGNTVTFTVTVSPSKSNPTTPTGTVTFFNGSIVLQTVTLVGGTASFATSSLPFGVSVISAIYSGDQNFATSTSTSLSQTINEPSTTTSTTTAAITSTTNSRAVPVPVALAVRSAATTSRAMAPLENPVKVVKKVASPKKVHPKGGSSTKFHQTKHAAVLSRSVAVITKHAKVKAKKK